MHTRTGELAWLAGKPDDLNLIPGIHMVEGFIPWGGSIHTLIHKNKQINKMVIHRNHTVNSTLLNASERQEP